MRMQFRFAGVAGFLAPARSPHSEAKFPSVGGGACGWSCVSNTAIQRLPKRGIHSMPAASLGITTFFFNGSASVVRINQNVAINLEQLRLQMCKSTLKCGFWMLQNVTSINTFQHSTDISGVQRAQNLTMAHKINKQGFSAFQGASVQTKSTKPGFFGISTSQRAQKIEKQGFRDCQRARKETL